ncbi:hypothetical protein SDC9_109585 [bioreactor metagenome]|uniref:Uncharacterized protein n=1 Tax=bioreactor metagenome TaxID=1076179 RepID=A0A645BCD4_9ZZZZ
MLLVLSRAAKIVPISGILALIPIMNITAHDVNIPIDITVDALETIAAPKMVSVSSIAPIESTAYA